MQQVRHDLQQKPWKNNFKICLLRQSDQWVCHKAVSHLQVFTVKYNDNEFVHRYTVKYNVNDSVDRYSPILIKAIKLK